MAELEPTQTRMPEGDERLMLLGLLAHTRYQQVSATPTGELGVSTLEATFSRVCSRGLTFEKLPLDIQLEVLAEAGVAPEFALDAVPLLPAIRAVTAAVERGTSVEIITSAVQGIEAA